MGTRFSHNVLQSIRDKADIVSIIEKYTHLEKRGDRWWGISPFKKEKTPSFSVQEENGLYYCFATHKGGDIFTLISELEGLSFRDAVRYLAELTGVSVDQGISDKEEIERTELLDLYRRVAGSFHYLLTKEAMGENTRIYLRNRAVTEEAIQRFQLGYAPLGKWLHQFLTKKSYTQDFLSKSGLFSHKYATASLFQDRLMFPIMNHQGQVIGFGGRALNNDMHAKYINSPENSIYKKKSSLYGLAQAIHTVRKTRRVYITEGYFDVISIAAAGCQGVVAPLGTAFTQEQIQLLKRWVNEIVLVFDGDEAGIAALLRAACNVEQAGITCKAVLMPSGKDPSDIFLKNGKEKLLSMIENPMPALDVLIASFSVSAMNINSRMKVLPKIFSYLYSISSEVQREAAFVTISEALGVSVSAISKDYQEWNGGTVRHSAKVPKFRITQELALMLAAAHNKEFFAYIRAQLSGGSIMLSDGLAQQMYTYLEDMYRRNEKFPAAVIDRLREDENYVILDKLVNGEYADWNMEGIKQAATLLQIRKLTDEQYRLQEQIHIAAKDPDDNVNTLLEEKILIDKKLTQLKES